MSKVASSNKKLEKFLSEKEKFAEAAKQLFNEADDDNNGILTFNEVASVTDKLFDSIEKDLATNGMKFNRPTAEQVEELLRQVDAENNCVLDESEFVEFYRQVVIYYAVVGREASKNTKRGFRGSLWKIVVATAGVFGVKTAAPYVPTMGPLLTPFAEATPALIVGPILGALWILMTRGSNNESVKKELLNDSKKTDVGSSKD